MPYCMYVHARSYLDSVYFLMSKGISDCEAETDEVASVHQYRRLLLVAGVDPTSASATWNRESLPQRTLEIPVPQPGRFSRGRDGRAPRRRPRLGRHPPRQRLPPVRRPALRLELRGGLPPRVRPIAVDICDLLPDEPRAFEVLVFPPQH